MWEMAAACGKADRLSSLSSGLQTQVQTDFRDITTPPCSPSPVGPVDLPRAYLDFEPEFPDARESFKCI